MNPWLPAWRRAALITLACGWIGCSRSPTVPEIVEAPAADSPQAALRLLEWCWNQRDATRYAGLLPADFVFQFAALDPYGTAYPDRSWTRSEERISTRNLFQGSASTPGAVTMVLALEPNFIVRSDPRPGKNPAWHRFIRSGLTLTVIDADQNRWDVTGTGDFYLVRGDSAMAPQDLIDAAVPMDSALWFVERWEDGTLINSGARALPARSSTLGAIKARHL